MSKSTTKLSRRAALAGLSTAAAMVPPGLVCALAGPQATAAALSGSDDAELLALGKELDACVAEFARLAAMPEFPDPAWDALRAAHPKKKDIVAYAMSRCNSRAIDALDAIMKQRPVTVDGLAVVARAARLEIDWWCTDVDGEVDDEREIQLSLAEAVLAFVARQKLA